MPNTNEGDAVDRISQYEAEYNLLQAEFAQQLDDISDLSGKARATALEAASATLDGMNEQLVHIEREKQHLPSTARAPVNRRFRDYNSDVDGHRRKLRSLGLSGTASTGDKYLDQRQQLLSGTDRLDQSSQRLKASEALAAQSEDTAARTLAELQRQREVIDHTNEGLRESETYLDRSIKTLKGMSRTWAVHHAYP